MIAAITQIDTFILFFIAEFFNHLLKNGSNISVFKKLPLFTLVYSFKQNFIHQDAVKRTRHRVLVFNRFDIGFFYLFLNHI